MVEAKWIKFVFQHANLIKWAENKIHIVKTVKKKRERKREGNNHIVFLPVVLINKNSETVQGKKKMFTGKKKSSFMKYKKQT